MSKDSKSEVPSIREAVLNQWVSHREDIKKLVEQEQMSLLQKTPDAVEFVKSLIPKNGKPKKMDQKEKELAYKASSDVLKAAGIMPSPVQSQIITNIYQEKALINPIIMQLLEERDKKFTPIKDVVDVEKEKL
jgi:hypothetical protein